MHTKLFLNLEMPMERSYLFLIQTTLIDIAVPALYSPCVFEIPYPQNEE